MKLILQIATFLITISSFGQPFYIKCSEFEHYYKDQSGIYQYDGKGYYEYNSQGKITRMLYHWNGSLTPTHKDTVIYNSFGNVLTQATFSFSNGNWTPIRKTEWTYNLLQYEVSEVTYGWLNNQYLADRSIEHYYSGNSLDSILYYGQDANLNQSLYRVTIVDSLNTNSQPVIEHVYRINGGNREYRGTRYYSHSSTGLLESKTIYGKCYNSSFDTCTIETYYYDSNNRDTLRLVNNIDTNGLYVLDGKTTREYDLLGNEQLHKDEGWYYTTWDDITVIERGFDTAYYSVNIQQPIYLDEIFGDDYQKKEENITNKVDWIKRTIQTGVIGSLQTDSVFYLYSPVLSINEEESRHFSIYPNPFEDYLTISKGQIDAYKIDLIDVSGKIVFSTFIDGLENTIDLSAVGNGIYTLRISALPTDKVEYYKLMKK